MLVAKRDPFHAHTDDGHHPAHPAGGFTRTMSMLQVVGSLLAIPVGAGSAYSFYVANFSAETACHSLRHSIVSTLDRSMDASARRMLVRRDVEAFEKTCGSVDPDATAAFKSLLAAKVAVARPVERVEVKPTAVAPQAAPVEAKADSKIESKPELKSAPKLETIAKPKAASAPLNLASREAIDQAASDAAWMAAVRRALVTGKATSEASPAAASIPATEPTPRESAVVVTAPVVNPSAAASVLPAPTSIAPPPEPAAQVQRVDDHPVPPGAIPETPPPEKKRSAIGGLVYRVPLVGAAVDAISGN